MGINSLTSHPDFPRMAWVVVEQPRDELYRISYDPVSETFFPSPNVKSLFHTRGFSGGVYGWIGGTGLPPEPHHDVILLTRQSPLCGEVLAGHICGVFLRRDGDHKFVAVDDDIRRGMAAADLMCLDGSLYRDLLSVYPRIDASEGWYGADVAFSYLLRKPLHD